MKRGTTEARPIRVRLHLSVPFESVLTVHSVAHPQMFNPDGCFPSQKSQQLQLNVYASNGYISGLQI